MKISDELVKKIITTSFASNLISKPNISYSLSSIPNTTGGVFLWLTSGIPWFVSLIAMAIMMIKPPKILTNLID